MLCRNNQQDELTSRLFLWKYMPYNKDRMAQNILYSIFLSIIDYKNYACY